MLRELSIFSLTTNGFDLLRALVALLFLFLRVFSFFQEILSICSQILQLFFSQFTQLFSSLHFIFLYFSCFEEPNFLIVPLECSLLLVNSFLTLSNLSDYIG